MKRLETGNAQWLQSKSHTIQGILHDVYQGMIAEKPRTKISPNITFETMRKLEQWVRDHGNVWTYTCESCVLCDEIYCTRKPLTMNEVIYKVIKTKQLIDQSIIHVPESFYQ